MKKEVNSLRSKRFRLFQSKERPRDRILGFGHARNKTPPRFFTYAIFRAVFDSRIPRSLLLNRTETLATQAKK